LSFNFVISWLGGCGGVVDGAGDDARFGGVVAVGVVREGADDGSGAVGEDAGGAELVVVIPAERPAGADLFQSKPAGE
jgi:hypothetical protein